MNIQMILSALPAQLSGKPQPGAGEGANAGQGHFALALDQAAHTVPGQAGNATLPTALSAAQVEGLPPPTMAAQQALLQALNAHATQALGDKAELARPDAQLEEVMARLALIEGTDPQTPEPLTAALQPLPSREQALPADGMNIELAEQAQAAALVAAAAPETQRPVTATPGAHTPGETAMHPVMPGGGAASSASGNPLTAQLAATTAGSSAVDVDADQARHADFTSALARTTANQPSGSELRAMAPEAARSGFVPDAAPMAQAQPGGTAAGQAGPAAHQPALPSQASLAAPVQSPAWPGQLGQQLVQFARQGGEQQIEMRLNPAELGPLSVTLKVTEQGAQAQFLSSHAQVRQVLEQAIPQLREALAEQGISLGETSVGEQRHQDAQAFANRNGRGQGGTDMGDETTALPGDAMPGTSSTLALDGRVNLYA